MPQIFICYSRQNQDIIKTLANDVEELGYKIWYDQELSGGQDWWNQILMKIRECDIFVFALTPEALKSYACKLELKYATDLGKLILPILIADGVSNNLLPTALTTIQYVDYRQQDRPAAFAFFKAVKNLPESQAIPDPLPAPPEVPISYLNTLKDQIETTKVLSFEEQTAILLKLEERLGNPDENNDVESLLEQMRKRDDLYAKVGEKIASLINTMKEQLKKRIVAPTYKIDTVPNKPINQNKWGGEVNAVNLPVKKQSGNVKTFRKNEKIKTKENSMSKKIQSFHAPNLSITDLTEALINWFSSLNFKSQTLQTEDGGLLIQIEKQGGWRKAVGMSTALNIVLRQNGDELDVEIGAGKWLDKALSGTVGVLILWPFAITAGIGAWNQMKMPEKVFQFVRDYVSQLKLGDKQGKTYLSESDHSVSNVIVELQKLAELKDKGVLTEEEFQEQKQRLLNQ